MYNVEVGMHACISVCKKGYVCTDMYVAMPWCGTVRYGIIYIYIYTQYIYI